MPFGGESFSPPVPLKVPSPFKLSPDTQIHCSNRRTVLTESVEVSRRRRTPEIPGLE